MTLHLKKSELVNVTGGIIYFKNLIKSKPQANLPKILFIQPIDENAAKDGINQKHALATLLDKEDINELHNDAFSNKNGPFSPLGYEKYTVEMFVAEMEKKYPGLEIIYV